MTLPGPRPRSGTDHPDIIIMTDTVLWEGSSSGLDALSEANLAQVEARDNQQDYVERGLSVTSNGDDTVDITGGYVRLTDGNYGYSAFPDPRSNVAMATGSGKNHIYACISVARGDPSVDDDFEYKVTTGADPSDVSAAVKIAIVDTGTDPDTVTAKNVNPEISAEAVSTEQINTSFKITPSNIDAADVGAEINNIVADNAGGPEYTRIDVQGEHTVNNPIDPSKGDYVILNLYGAKLTMADGLESRIIGGKTYSSTITAWKVLGGRLDVNRANQSAGGSAITFGRDSAPTLHDQILVRDVEVLNARNNGIILEASNSRIESCETNDCGTHGQVIFYGSNNLIIGGVDKNAHGGGGGTFYNSYDIESSTDTAVVDCVAKNLPDIAGNSNAFSSGGGEGHSFVNCRVRNAGGSTYQNAVGFHGNGSINCTIIGGLARNVSGKAYFKSGSTGTTIVGLDARNDEIEVKNESDVELRGVRAGAITIITNGRSECRGVSLQGCQANGQLRFKRNTNRGENDIIDEVVIDGGRFSLIRLPDGVANGWVDFKFSDLLVKAQRQKTVIDFEYGVPDYLTMEGLTVVGQGGSDNHRGIRIRGDAEKIIIRDFIIRNVAREGIETTATATHGLLISDGLIKNYNTDDVGEKFGSGIQWRDSDGRIENVEFIGASSRNPNINTGGERVEIVGCDVSDGGVSLGDGSELVGENRGLAGVSFEPTNPYVGASYIDDGTNTASGNLARRIYDGTSWVDQN
jgi:hypothetical protein